MSKNFVTPPAWLRAYTPVQYLLAKNYQDNDRICIFGFSRGAYSARALAGMLKAMGLLTVSDTASAKAAYDLYEEPSMRSRCRSSSSWAAGPSDSLFLSDFIHLLLGTRQLRKLAHTATNDIVRTFRHAVALDERRAMFKSNLWSQPKKAAVAAVAANSANAQPSGDNGPSVDINDADVQEVWFAGCHCVGGGGSVLNGTRPNLAHIPLRWMIRECFKARTGMLFSAIELAKLGIEPSHLYLHVRPRPVVDAVTRGNQTIRAIEAPSWVPWAKSFLPSTPETGQGLMLPNMSEEELDARDALAPLYDQLVLKSGTWQAMEPPRTRSRAFDTATTRLGALSHPRRVHMGVRSGSTARYG
ncbi:hypothetical protein C8J57DRAFT_1090063 [Mycena rebaudengoi]|nr:hypothetical protein C8J57DRAFT_1090063 [Mycena rebaudengoi]